jgi:hypothetical protein
MPSERIWQGEAEHHFAVVAFDHMLEALNLWPVPVQIPKIVEQEEAEVRDLATHWKENMPVFNRRPRSLQPKYPSGKSFMARNPERGPYCWWAWSSWRGAMLTPNVAASDARDAIHTAEQAVLAADPDLARFRSSRGAFAVDTRRGRKLVGAPEVAGLLRVLQSPLHTLSRSATSFGRSTGMSCARSVACGDMLRHLAGTLRKGP